ncbi:MAG: helix-turn-helix transcriptional regulator [Crocosphaera sp.]
MRITKPLLQVLAVFLDKPSQQLSGSDICDQTKLSTGTVYPILFRLEQNHWLCSEWEQVEPKKVGRPRKRLYSLTNKGLIKAQDEFDKLNDLLSRRKQDGLVRDF